MEKSSKVYVGMDVHKESIEVTLAEVGGELRRLGQIARDQSVLQWPRSISSRERSIVSIFAAYLITDFA
jgi:hypothetical protein